MSSLEVGQLWIPNGRLDNSRQITGMSENTYTGKFWVDYALPQRCPCCERLLRTDKEIYECDSLEEFLEWIKNEKATCSGGAI